MESPKGFLGDGLMKGLLIEMRTELGENRKGRRGTRSLGSVGSLFHSGTWKDLGEGTGLLPEPTQRWSTVTTWQGRGRPRSASILISLFPPSHLLPVSPN